MKSIIKTNQPEVGHGIGIFDPTIVKMKLSSSIRTSIDKLKPFFFVRFHSFLTCVVPVFPLTLLLNPSFTPVKIVACDL